MSYNFGNSSFAYHAFVINGVTGSTANTYKKTIGPGIEDFDCHIAVENFKIIPDAYTVTISKKRFLHFKHETKPIEYWLACDPESTV